MSHLFGYLSGAGAVAQGAAGALIAGLWESALLVAGVWLVLKAVPRTTAAARFAMWTAVFCVSAAMPVAGALFGARLGVSAGQVQAGLHVDARWSYVIAAVWAVAVLVRLAGLALQGWKLRSLWKRAVPVSDERLAAAGCDELLAVRPVRVCTSEDVDRPSVIGFFAPRILIPAWLFEQLSAVELRHIVLHEMEHLRRRDDWMNLVQKMGLVLFPLNPALLWVDRRLAAERELACDDGVLRRTQMPRAYAASLASIAEMRLERRMHRRVVALALGALGVAGIFRGRSEFSRRIESILSWRASVSPRLAGLVAAVLVTTILGAGVGLAHAPQLISFAPVNVAGSVAAASGSVSAGGLIERGGLLAGAGVREVGFRVSETQSLSTIAMRSQSLPQRLKARGEGGVYGTAEAVPISKTGFVPSRKALHFGKTGVGRSAGASAGVASVRAGLDGQSRAVNVNVQSRRVTEQFVVLTSFGESQIEEEAPARVAMRLGTGRVYVVPYAAVPIRDGWLIVQL